MIRKASEKDLGTVVDLALKLWPEHSGEELAQEYIELLNNPKCAIFLAEEGLTIGFAQCQLRKDYVEGAHGSPVGYLEGIYVLEGFRHSGIASDLLRSCEKWAAEHGCEEFASDCELSNSDSREFHLRTGFEEVNRIICFVKQIGADKQIEQMKPTDRKDDWPDLTYEQKNERLFRQQKALLDQFLEKGAISQAQHDQSLRDLTEKMREPGSLAVLGSQKH